MGPPGLTQIPGSPDPSPRGPTPRSGGPGCDAADGEAGQMEAQNSPWIFAWSIQKTGGDLAILEEPTGFSVVRNWHGRVPKQWRVV